MELSPVAIDIRGVGMFWLRLHWSIVPAAWLAAMLSLAQESPCASAAIADAQNGDGTITVVSVLEMAKTAAEQADRQRVWLMLRVAEAMERTGRTDAFGSYVSDAKRAAEEAAYGHLPLRDREILEANRALDAEAKRALLSGDPESAKQYLGRCRFVPHYDTCDVGGIFFDVRFLFWEAEAGDLAAAVRRLKTRTDWQGLRPAMTLRVARAYVAAGRRSEAVDLLREAHVLASDADFCIVENREMGFAARLRQLACNGQARTAVETAMASLGVSARTVALAVVAEGLAGIPGFSDERLER